MKHYMMNTANRPFGNSCPPLYSRATHCRRGPSRNAGFTLIELMIVVTILGIISSLAYTAFTGYTAAADRGDAQAGLYELAQIMERGYTEDRDYGIDMGDALTNFNTDSRYTYDVVLPAGVNPQTFRITAEADNGARDPFDLSIDERGIEEFRAHGTTAWSGTTGWDNIR